MEVYGVAIVCGEGVALFGVIVAVPIIGDDVFVSCVVICVVCVVML